MGGVTMPEKTRMMCERIITVLEGAIEEQREAQKMYATMREQMDDASYEFEAEGEKDNSEKMNVLSIDAEDIERDEEEHEKILRDMLDRARRICRPTTEFYVER